MQAFSAGGLLLGGMLNTRPGLFVAAVAHAPFVDMLTTATDPSLPLTVHEYDEWGEPGREPKALRTIASMCPYRNCSGAAGEPVPAVMVTCALDDTRVPFWGPAKWVARLQKWQRVSGGGPVLLLCSSTGGHFGGGAGEEKAVEAAFLIAAVSQRRAASGGAALSDRLKDDWSGQVW
jgi:oligopeptidase B